MPDDTQPAADRFPIGRTLMAVGLVLLVAVIALSFVRIYTGTRAVLGEITGPELATHTLPAGEFVLTRAEGLSEDRAVAATLDSVYGVFTPDADERWITFNNERNLILGSVTINTPGQVSLSIGADAYPVQIRHDRVALTERILLQGAAAGSVGAVLFVVGLAVALRRLTATQRRSQRDLERLMDDSA